MCAFESKWARIFFSLDRRSFDSMSSEQLNTNRHTKSDNESALVWVQIYAQAAGDNCNDQFGMQQTAARVRAMCLHVE